jgi:hypothetical protein
VEEESGIGGSMVRTRGKEVSGPLSEAGEQVNEPDDALLMAQVTERALRGDGKSINALKAEPEAPGGSGDASKASGFSQALAWAAESEWQGEASESQAETASGSREPENLG